jgi:hypothetical protein
MLPLSRDLPVVLVSTLVVLVPTLVLIRSNMTQSKGFMALVLQRIHSLYRTSPLLRTVAQLLPNKPPKGLPPLTRFEKVSSRAVRVLGLNPGAHTLQGTNTWLVTGTDTEGAHILVDTGEAHSAEQYISLLFDEVFPTTGTKRLSHILLTHGHGDHQGGVLRLLSELKSRNMLPLPTIYKRHMDSGGGGGGDFPAVGFECKLCRAVCSTCLLVIESKLVCTFLFIHPYTYLHSSSFLSLPHHFSLSLSMSLPPQVSISRTSRSSP